MNLLIIISVLITSVYSQVNAPQISPQMIAAIQTRAHFCLGEHLPASPEVELIKSKILSCQDIYCGQMLVGRVIQLYPTYVPAIRECFRAAGF